MTVEHVWLDPDFLELRVNGKHAGHMRVDHLGSSADVLGYTRCVPDFSKMIRQYGHLPVVQVNNVEIAWRLRRAQHATGGIGRAYYLAAISGLRQQYPGGFYFVPANCGKFGLTKPGAFKLWQSLARSFPSRQSRGGSVPSLVLYIGPER